MINITKKLDTTEMPNESFTKEKSIRNAMVKCKNHPGIVKIKEYIDFTKKSFDYVSIAYIDKLILCLGNLKAIGEKFLGNLLRSKFSRSPHI